MSEPLAAPSSPSLLLSRFQHPFHPSTKTYPPVLPPAALLIWPTPPTTALSGNHLPQTHLPRSLRTAHTPPSHSTSCLSLIPVCPLSSVIS
ncbi:hypothetical protein Hanom_Chr09g00805281 [Helianthus anomalus]